MREDLYLGWQNVVPDEYEDQPRAKRELTREAADAIEAMVERMAVIYEAVQVL